MRALSVSLLLSVLLTSSLTVGAASKPAKPVKKTEPAAKPEMLLAHPFGQSAEAELQKLVDRFNGENPGMPIRLVRLAEGGKPALLNILRRTQVAEFTARKAAFKPLHAVLKEGGQSLDAAAISRDLRNGVVDDKGRLVALPVAYSTVVLFYNRNAFRKAKLDPDNPPATWAEMQEAAGKLLAAGYECPYTTSWPTWVHVDNISALSGSPVTNGKGDLAFNGFVGVKHLAKLSSWKKTGYFHVFGRRDEADDKFRDGECVMLTSNSSAYVDFLDAKGIELGVAPLPHYDDNFGGRQSTLADGASLWIGGDHKAADYKAAAQFVKFMLKPETQLQLANAYGQLPMTQAARDAIRDKAPRGQAQALEVAYASLKGEGNRSPVRISAIDPVRIILDEELEKLWADRIPPKQALDVAVTRGNAVLKARPGLRKVVPF